MPRTKYRFDPESLHYKEVQYTMVQKFVRMVLPQLLAAIVIGILMFIAYTNFFDSPQESRLKRENNKMVKELDSINQKFEKSLFVLEDLERRDQNIYRTLFEVEPIPLSERMSSITNMEKYANLSASDKLELITQNQVKIDSLKAKIYNKDVEYQQFFSLIEQNLDYLRDIPAIMPIQNKELKYMIYGFGDKLDPVYKTPTVHNGVDFGAPEGTLVIATADGVVSAVDYKARIHGMMVTVTHRSGYTTVYAHLSEISVRTGQRLKRYDKIGLVGNTGKSTAPHIHYEILKDGKHINPVTYFFLDLTPEMFAELEEMAARGGLTLD